MPSSAGSRQVDVALTERETEQAQRMLGDPTVFPQVFKNWVSAWTEQEVAVSLNQIQGWSDFLNSQTAKDAGQNTSIAANTAGVNSANSQIATTNSQVTANANGISSLNSQMSAANSKNTTQDSRLAALEAAGGGGVSVYFGYDATTATTSSSYSTWRTVGSGPVANVNAGSYLVIYGCGMQVGGAGANAGGYMGVSVGGSDPSSTAQTVLYYDNRAHIHPITAAFTGSVGSVALYFEVKTVGAISSFTTQNRWIAALKYA